MNYMIRIICCKCCYLTDALKINNFFPITQQSNIMDYLKTTIN